MKDSELQELVEILHEMQDSNWFNAKTRLTALLENAGGANDPANYTPSAPLHKD